MSVTDTDRYWMQQALALADEAVQHDEVPVGALVVLDGRCIGRGFNRPVSGRDPTAHAEIQALRDAAQYQDNYRLPDCTLYVTIEPCTMCLGAMVHARIGTLVFGAREPRYGAVVSGARLLETAAFNHYPAYREGVLAEGCAEVMRAFFRRRRA